MLPPFVIIYRFLQNAFVSVIIGLHTLPVANSILKGVAIMKVKEKLDIERLKNRAEKILLKKEQQEDFIAFLQFCSERLNKGYPVQSIWNDYQGSKLYKC